MNTKQEKKVLQAIALLEDVVGELEELSSMNQAEELHGQEFPPDTDDQLMALQAVIDDLNTL